MPQSTVLDRLQSFEPGRPAVQRVTGRRACHARMAFEPAAVTASRSPHRARGRGGAGRRTRADEGADRSGAAVRRRATFEGGEHADLTKPPAGDHDHVRGSPHDRAAVRLCHGARVLANTPACTAAAVAGAREPAFDLPRGQIEVSRGWGLSITIESPSFTAPIARLPASGRHARHQAASCAGEATVREQRDRVARPAPTSAA